MADKETWPLKGFGFRDRFVWGTFAPDGANAPTYVFPTKRRRWTVARTAQGVWTVTLLDDFFEWRPLSALLQLNAATTREMQIGAKTATTFEIRNVDAANTAQDIAANANNTITFMIGAVDTSG